VAGQWAYTAQLGASYTFHKQWFVDGFYSYTPLKTTTTLSTGQTQEITLNPSAYGLSLGYKF
jgi:outer membrane protein